MPSSARYKPTLFRWLVVLLILLFLVVGAWLAAELRQRRELESEAIRFARAEQDITELTQEIIKVAGEPLKSETDKSCFLRSVKYEEQPISCSVTGDLFYGVDDEAEATRIHQATKRVLDARWTLKSISASDEKGRSNIFALPEPAQSENESNYRQIKLMYVNRDTDMSCGVASALYASEKPPFEEFKIDTVKKYLINIGLRCNDDSSAIRYEVK